MRLLGVGNLDMASVIDGLILYPLSDMIKPAKSTSFWAYCYFLMFRVMCFSLHRHMNCWMFSACYSILLSKITSSTMRRNPVSSAKASYIQRL